MTKFPAFEAGKYSRYNNEDGSTTVYKDGKYMGTFDNETMFCNLFYTMATEIEKQEQLMKKLNETALELVRFTKGYIDCDERCGYAKCSSACQARTAKFNLLKQEFTRD